MASITINGKNSYDDFNALLTKRSISPPSIINISETLPYSDGDVCFTYQNGGRPNYSTRTLTYTFEFVDYPKDKLRDDVTRFENWIFRNGICELYDDSDFYHFTARPISCSESEKGFKCEVTVKFTAQPFKRSDDFSDCPFDEFNFATDCMNQSVISISASSNMEKTLNVYSYADRPIRPRLSYKKTGSSIGQAGFTKLKVNGETIDNNCYHETENEFDLDEFVLEPGLNSVSVSGFGTLTIRLVEEVL